MKKRGQLTGEVSNIWREFQDNEEMQINKDDLRFFAHLDYVIKNNKRLKYDSLNEFDLDCLFFLYDQSYVIIKKIDDEDTEDWIVTHVDREFNSVMQEILYEAYIDV